MACTPRRKLGARLSFVKGIPHLRPEPCPTRGNSGTVPPRKPSCGARGVPASISWRATPIYNLIGSGQEVIRPARPPNQETQPSAEAACNRNPMTTKAMFKSRAPSPRGAVLVLAKAAAALSICLLSGCCLFQSSHRTPRLSRCGRTDAEITLNVAFQVPDASTPTMVTSYFRRYRKGDKKIPPPLNSSGRDMMGTETTFGAEFRTAWNRIRSSFTTSTSRTVRE